MSAVRQHVLVPAEAEAIPVGHAPGRVVEAEDDDDDDRQEEEQRRRAPVWARSQTSTKVADRSVAGFARPRPVRGVASGTWVAVGAGTDRSLTGRSRHGSAGRGW